MNATFQFKLKNPITGRRRNPTPISEEYFPPRDAFDREVDNAVREGRAVDYTKLCIEYHADLSDKMTGSLPECAEERAETIVSYGDMIDKEEIRHRIMHRLLSRQFSVTEIATVLGVSVRQAHRLVVKLRKKYVAHAKDMRFQEYVGETIFHFKDCIATMLRIFDDNTIPIRDRIAILRLVNDIKTSELRFLHLIGFFEHGVVRAPGEDER